MLKLTVGFAPNPRIEPLLDGTVKSQNINLNFVLCPPAELFYRNLKYNEFDVFEMSISEYVILKTSLEAAQWKWSGLPIFPRKAFIWLNLFVNTSSGINGPGDLKHKRVGVPDYPITASVWMRIVLNELYGITPSEISWYIGRAKDVSHGWILGFGSNPLKGVTLEWISEEQTLDRMLQEGALDAAYGFPPPPAALGHKSYLKIDRYGGVPVNGNPKIGRLFPDGGRQIMAEFYRRHQFLPTNHMVVIQQSILDREPWAALELYKAFQEAKFVAYERAKRSAMAYLLFEGEDVEHQSAAFGEDPYPYGLRANRKMLEALFQWEAAEGLSKRLARVEDIFASTTLAT
jgi:4,5-dihydroxyphthalate decarboxylase